MQVPVDLRLHRGVGAVVAGQPGQVVVAEVVVRGGRVTPVRLEQADHVVLGVGPEPVLRLLRLDIGVQVVRPVVVRERHRQVAGQQVEQGGDVGRALDGRMPAQRHNPAAGPAHVAEQRLQDGRGPDVLHADRVLGPAQAVHERGGPVAARVLGDQPGHLAELLRRHAGHLGHQVRGVPGEVPLEDLEHAPRVLQRGIGVRLRVRGRAARAMGLTAGRRLHLPPVVRLQAAGAAGRGDLLALVAPGLRVIAAVLRVEPGEHPVQVLGVLEVLGDDGGGVGVADHVVVEVLARAAARS